MKLPSVWQEASALIYAHRHRLSVGLVLMLLNRLSGFVLPLTSKSIIDDVVGKQDIHLLYWLAGAAFVANDNERKPAPSPL